jgi:DNA integrity scanning protein DisA with diadenylate cyclase activity
MSPAEAGATLVWSLRAHQLAQVTGLSASREPTAVPSLSFSGRATRAAIRQLLSQVDGAGIVVCDGQLIAIGAQLRSSAQSHATVRIDPARGTRHASAQRYSFDHPDTIVFVISRDGPVTVYATGAEITSIRMTTDNTQAYSC